jgi:hypothetical protein
VPEPHSAPATPDPFPHPARTLWAALLACIFEIFPMTCTHCGGEIRLIALATEPEAIRYILEHLGEPTAPSLIAAARSPPIEAAELDQSIPDAGPEASPAPEVEFDQTVSG